MVAYSLINCSSDYFSIGIYTSLENLYVALKSEVYKCLEYNDAIKDIKEWYEIIQVNLDSEPLDCCEFSTYGKQIKIDWKKILDN